MSGSVQKHSRTGKWFLKLYLNRKQYSIWTDRLTNGPFLSRQQGNKALGLIQDEIDKGIFDPSQWKRKKIGLNSINGNPNKNNNKLLRNYAVVWLENRNERVRQGTLVKRTVKDDRTHLRKYILPMLGDKLMDSITKTDIDNFKAKIQRSPSGISNVQGTLQKLLNDAVEEGIINSAPKFPSKPKKSQQAKKYLKQYAIDLIISCISEKERFIFQCIAEYGMRIGEARAIRKECVANGTLIINAAFSENTFRESTKTGEIRELPITPYFQRVLEEIPPNDSEFLFVKSENGKTYTSKDLNTLWHKACKDAGQGYFKLYNLRHSKARNLLEQGYGYDMAAEVLGHSSVETTRQFYADMPLCKISDALENLRN